MTDVWFTSDLHFGHRYVAELRGFPTPEDHDHHLIQAFNARVKPSDIVWILGDLSSGGSAATRHALDKLAYMNGHKRLIAGNHDPIHPMNRDAHKWANEFAREFEYVSPFARVSINGTRVMLSHFPYTADRKEQRYGQYRLRDEGMPLIHGHLHVSSQVTSPREIHVGVDAWGLAPVRADEIEALLNE